MKYITDENGKWEVGEGYKALIEPSDKWINDNKRVEEATTHLSEIEELTNYVLGVDLRLVMVEMGLM